MRILILSAIFIGILGCNQKEETSTIQANAVPQDFMDFYRKFHSDSLFQISHINFPLEGLPSYADPEDLKDGKFYWKLDEWQFQRSIDFEFSDFERVLMPINDFLIEETILHKKDKLALQRKYVKFGEEWTLIYYSGLNPYSLNN